MSIRTLGPIGLEAAGQRIGIRHQCPLLPVGERLAVALLRLVVLADELGLLLRVQQVLDHRHRDRGVDEWTTGSAYAGAILTAVCLALVVAPPIRSGIFIPRRCISRATWTISSSDGVIRPLRPTVSAFFSMAVSRILSDGTITPRSITSKLLQRRTTPTMFLPMSCTSPFTVAITIVPRCCGPSEPSFSASMNGVR